MQLTEIRRLARAEYGLEWSSSEDQLYSQQLLNACINGGHHFFAGVSLCYRGQSSLSLSSGGGIGATGTYALPATVIEPDQKTFYLVNGSSKTMLPHRFEHSLLEQYGPNEGLAAGVPSAFCLQAGAATNGQTRTATFWPPPNGAMTVKFSAFVYPADMVNDTDVCPLPDPDVYRLIPAICWKLAEFDFSRGRDGAAALVEMWSKRALMEAMEYQRIIRNGTRDFARTPAVGASPLDDAMARAQPFGGK